MPSVARELICVQRGLRGDGVDERDQRQDALHLAALKPADEVPLEELAEALVLSLQVVQAVLADQVDPGLGERWQLVVGHVLRRDENANAVAGLLAHLREPLAHARGVDVGDQLGHLHTIPAWRPVTPPSRRCE